MKRILCLLVLLILFNGCKANVASNTTADGHSTNEITEIPTVNNYGEALAPTILESSFLYQNKFTISYPVIEGSKDFTAVNTAIRNTVEEDLRDSFGETPALEAFELDCRSELIDSQYISIHYTGACYVTKAAHPSTLHFTYVFDIGTGKRMSLEAFVTLDDVFLDEFRTAWKDQVLPELKDHLSDITNDDLRTQIQRSKYTVFETYVTIIYVVPHAAGDYALIVLKT